MDIIIAFALSLSLVSRTKNDEQCELLILSSLASSCSSAYLKADHDVGFANTCTHVAELFSSILRIFCDQSVKKRPRIIFRKEGTSIIVK